MKRILNLIFVFTCIYHTGGAQVLTQKSDFIEPRHRAFSFMLGNKFYTGTGTDANFVMNNQMYEYDVSADSWSQLNDFPTQPVRNGISMVINDTAYAGLAWDGTNRIGWYQYNVTNDSWTLKNSTCNAGQFSGIFSLNSKGYSVGGSGGVATHSELWEYDPSLDIWNQKANFPGVPRDLLFAETANGYAFAGFGDGFFGAPFYSDVYKYDPSMDSWSTIAPIPNSSTNAVAEGGCSFHASWNGKVILMSITGISTTNLSDYNTIYVYDPVNDSWTLYENFNPVGARGTPLTAQYGSKAYYGSGDDFINGIKQDFWEVDLDALMTSVEVANPGVKNISVTASSHHIYVNIPNELKEKENLSLELFNMNGKILQQYKLDGSDCLEVSPYSFGPYVYCVKSNTRILKSGKFMLD